MRVDATILQQLVSSAGQLQSRQGQIAGEISSGVRLQSLSDDPAAVAKAGNLSNSLQQADTFLTTATSVQNRVQAADSALAGVVSQLTSALTTVVGAEGGTLTPQQQSQAAQTLTTVRGSLLSLANSSYAGSYLFAGTATGSAPFTQASDGTVSYVGDAGTQNLTLLSGGSIATNLPGSQVFTNAGASVFGALNSLITQLQGGGGSTPTTLVNNLRGALSNILEQRQTLDSSLSRISDETSFQTAQETNLKAAQSTLLSADTVSLATSLSQVATQRSALLSTIATVEKGSLFDYLH